jgi:hypothetical protein
MYGNFGGGTIPCGKGRYRADMVKMPVTQYNVPGKKIKLVKEGDDAVAFFAGINYRGGRFAF